MINTTGKSGGTLLREKALDKAIGALNTMLDENDALIEQNRKLIRALQQVPESRPESRCYYR